MGSKAQRRSILVIGAGSWGTALAQLLASNGSLIQLWTRDSEQVALMQANHNNERYFPGFKLHTNITFCSDLTQAREENSDILLAVPSHAIEAVLNQLKQLCVPKGLCWAVKGIEPKSKQLISERVQHYFPNIQMAMIAGPSFAKEVMQGLATAITIVSNQSNFAEYWASLLRNDYIRVYRSDDLISAQIAGTMKNVLAIACGISDGLGFGVNARAALITRGLAEMTRLGVKMGGEAKSFSDLEGIGDLLLTCTDNQSRNRRFGLYIGQGETIQAASEAVGQVVEGLHNAKQIIQLAQRYQEILPICQEVAMILEQNKTPAEAAQSLLQRTQINAPLF